MIHTPFEDRVWAGRLLATELTRSGVPPDAIVMALAPGGVPVGHEVADRLRLALDVQATRRIAVPWQPEITIGAVVGAETVLDEPLIRALSLSPSEVAEIAQNELEAVALDNARYHQHAPKLDLGRRAVILVDDGLETGDTMLAAVRDVHRFHPPVVIAAAPVGPQHAFARLENEAARVVFLNAPECLVAIGEHFRHFDDVTEDDIERLLLSNRQTERTQRITRACDIRRGDACALSPNSACFPAVTPKTLPTIR